MNPTLARHLAGFDRRSIRDAGAVATLAALLGVVGGLSLVASIALPVVAVVIALYLRGAPYRPAEEYGLTPVLVALGVLTVLASPTFLVAVLAGLTGLALLLWNAETPKQVGRRGDPVEGLLLPGAGLAVALLAGATLPAANAAVGLAALAVVVAFALVLWALARVLGEPAPGEAL